MISKEYLAGFIDGEGYIGLTKHSDGRVKRGFTIDARFTITNTNDVILHSLQKQIGGRIALTGKQMKNAKSIYRLVITDMPTIKRILCSVLPFLIVKKEQAGMMIRFCDLRKKGAYRYADDELRIVEAVCRLNKRGAGILGVF